LSARDEITVEMDATLWREVVHDLTGLIRQHNAHARNCATLTRWRDYFAEQVPAGCSGLVGVRGDVSNFAQLARWLMKYRMPSRLAVQTAVARAMHPGRPAVRVDAATMAGARQAAAEMDAGGDGVLHPPECDCVFCDPEDET